MYTNITSTIVILSKAKDLVPSTLSRPQQYHT